MWRPRWSERVSAAAADRRRHHQPRAHGGEDQSQLRARPDHLRHRCEPGGRRGVEPDVGCRARPVRGQRAQGVRQDPRRLSQRRNQEDAGCRYRPHATTAFKIDWAGYTPPKPTARHATFKSYELAELVPYIDWTPFFQTWELHGKYPAHLRGQRGRPRGQEAVRRCAGHAEALVAEKWLTANAVIGFWPANAVGDDIELYADDARKSRLATLHTLRQQMARENRSRPRQHGARRFHRAQRDRARRLHRRLRRHVRHRRGRGAGPLHRQDRRLRPHHAEGAGRPAGRGLRRAHARARAPRVLGLRAGRENSTSEELIAEQYRGIRPAPGYPAQPDHTEKATIFRAARREKPGRHHSSPRASPCGRARPSPASISPIPESHYFGVGKVERDQVEDYARRKGWSVEEAERWLGPVLNYERAPASVARSAMRGVRPLAWRSGSNERARGPTPVAATRLGKSERRGRVLPRRCSLCFDGPMTWPMLRVPRRP